MGRFGVNCYSLSVIAKIRLLLRVHTVCSVTAFIVEVSMFKFRYYIPVPISVYYSCFHKIILAVSVFPEVCQIQLPGEPPRILFILQHKYPPLKVPTSFPKQSTLSNDPNIPISQQNHIRFEYFVQPNFILPLISPLNIIIPHDRTDHISHHG